MRIKQFLKTNTILLLFFVSALVVLLIAVYSAVLIHNSGSMLEQTTGQRLISLSKLAATLASAEELERLQTAEDMEEPLYAQIKDRLIKFAEESSILYAYYLRPDGSGGIRAIVDNDLTEDAYSLADPPLEMEEGPALALSGEANCQGLGIYSTSWDGLLTAYAPVYAADGSVYCVAGVDISDTEIVSSKNSLRIMSAVLVISMIIAVSSGYAGVVLYRKKAHLSESANIAKSQFLSRMSHEIRTPMNAIIGLCRMAKESDDMDQVKSLLDNINISSGHLLKLINDVLDLSKIESGKMEAYIVPADLKAEIENIRKVIAPQAEAKRQRFIITVDAAIPDFLYCDILHLNQVAVNLLANAVKFTPETGKISFDISLADRRADEYNIEFRVKDNGIGIDDQHLKKIFDPFEQGDGGTTRKYGGSGLGLAISKQFVEMMNGTISVFSLPGEGSEFTFSLWLKEAQGPAAAPGKEDAGQRADLAGKHILLVEDSEINRMIAEDVFTGMGAQVDTAETGLAGFTRFVQNPEKYSYIFMDIQMPVMDGYEATRRIRAAKVPCAKTIPIIAMTANVFKEDIENALQAGMDAHVGKPFEIEHIEQTIIDLKNREAVKS